MPVTHTITRTTRWSDLDTQRHVTSRTYEAFAYDARLELLAEQGLTLQKLLECKAIFQPELQYIRFLNQQHAGANVIVHTTAFSDSRKILFQQDLETPDGQKVCQLILKTSLKGQALKAPAALQTDKHDPTLKAARSLLVTPAEFSGKCQRTVTEFTALFSDRDFTGQYPPAALWRILEEGRWSFSQKLGLTYDLFRKIDTITFFMGGVIHYQRLPQAGQAYLIHTWIERIDKIRCFFRQTVTDSEGQEFLSISEEQLIVSLSRARPRRAPAEFLDVVGNYLEYSDAGPS